MQYSNRSFYSAEIQQFVASDPNLVLGVLTENSGFSIETTQRDAWRSQIQILQKEQKSLTGDTQAPNKSALTVLVQHSPAFFDKPVVAKRMVNQRFDLCLAGHTHGGQLAIGGWALYTPVGSGRFVAGFYDVPGCPLFVSRGAGTSVLPLRLGARAEVVVFDL